VSGQIDDRRSGRIAKAIRSKVNGEIAVEVDSAAGAVRADSSADPQIEGEGLAVEIVSD
jgi:hypothetical protein